MYYLSMEENIVRTNYRPGLDVDVYINMYPSSSHPTPTRFMRSTCTCKLKICKVLVVSNVIYIWILDINDSSEYIVDCKGLESHNQAAWAFTIPSFHEGLS